MPRIAAGSNVDTQAELADDAEIGPGCVVEGRVTIGPGTRLIGNVYLHGPLTIGAENLIYPFCCIGFEPQELGFDATTNGAGVRIGDRNHFRESVTIHRATGEHPTTIGSDNYFMVNSHAAHDVVVGDGCILANGALLAGHVLLQDGVILAGNAGVHQFCRIGRLAIISGCEAIIQDMPPFCTSYETRKVGSLNLVGLRRAGYRQHIKPLQQAFDILYRHSHTNAAVVELIEQKLGDDPLCAELAAFVRDSIRGITPYGGSVGRDE